MTPNDGTRRLPALRPLACGVMLALTALPSASLMARPLNGETETIDENAAVEDWHLSNRSKLTVNNGSTNTIISTDSEVELNGATVTRINAGAPQHSMELRGNSTGIGNNTSFVGGGILVNDSSTLTLTGSSITIDETAPGMGTAGLQPWGISINAPTGTDKPVVVLDSTSIRVTGSDVNDLPAHGVGIFMAGGDVTLRNGSSVDADYMGVGMHGGSALPHALSLTLNASHIVAGTGAGIEVMAGTATNNTYNILVASGSTVSGGDGNLLKVRAFNDGGASGDNQITFTVDDSDLVGNIMFDDTNMTGNNRVDVVLRNNASILGTFTNVTSANIDSNSAWTLTGDSSVGQLDLGATGSVVLGDGLSGFNTLTLHSFTGAGGTLVFNTKLEGDTSLTDKLVINGDANGTAGVRVNNAGGQGAQTINGIELIDINGASNAVFNLIGRAVGGQYEYFLVKGADGSWYLKSELPVTPEPNPCDDDPTLCEVTLPVLPVVPDPDVCEVDPRLCEVTLPVLPEITPDPPAPKPVLRPETGAYLANDAAMGALLAHRAADRNAMDSNDGLRTWASVDSGERRMDAVGQQALKADHTRVQIGADIGVFDGGNGRIGALLTAGQAGTNSRSTVTGYQANGEVKGGAFGVYAGWSNGTTFVDASVQQGRFSNQVHGDGLDVERYKTRVSQASVEAGHRFDAGQIGGMVVQVQPELQLTYTRTAMDFHVESNGTVIERAGGNGLSTRAGVRLLGEAGTGALQWQPYVSLHAVHNGSTPALSFDGEVIEGGAPRRALELGAGTQLQIGNGLSAWGGLNFSNGSDSYRALGAKVGVAYRW